MLRDEGQGLAAGGLAHLWTLLQLQDHVVDALQLRGLGCPGGEGRLGLLGGPWGLGKSF